MFLFSHDPHRNISFIMKSAAFAKPGFFPAIAVRLVQCTCNISSLLLQKCRLQRKRFSFANTQQKNIYCKDGCDDTYYCFFFTFPALGFMDLNSFWMDQLLSFNTGSRRCYDYQSCNICRKSFMVDLKLQFGLPCFYIFVRLTVCQHKIGIAPGLWRCITCTV